MTEPRDCAAVRVTLFGHSCLHVRGKPQPLHAPPRTWPLLARLLVLRGEPVERKRLAAELWPDEPGSDGRAQLRRHLHYLDRALQDAGAAALTPERRGQTLWLPVRPCAEVDYWRFAAARDDADIESALRLCMEDLLQEYDDDWIVPFRDEARKRRDTFLERLVDLSRRRGEHERALHWAEAGLRLDPFDDRALRRVMLLQARAGNRAAALVAFRHFQAQLASELEARPEPATLALAEALADLRDIRAPWSPLDLLPNNLPASIELLIGRDDDVAVLVDALETARLVSIVGLPGVGKTRLARAVGEAVLSRRQDGVWLVDLAAIRGAGLVASAVARALGVTFFGSGRPVDAMLARLRERRALLLLDNCEHVLAEAAELCDALLAGCARLGILITSREPLGRAGENVYMLEPLVLPPSFEDDGFSDESVISSPAGALFLARYTGTLRSGRPVRANLRDVAALCRLTSGIPLALELVAAAARRSELAAVRASLERDAPLSVERGSREARWATMHEALAWSLRLLGEAQHATLLRVAVFSSAFSAEIAARLLGERADETQTIAALAELARKSLLTTDDVESPRLYRMPAPVRDHALLQLSARGEERHWRERHAALFADLAERWEIEFGTMPTGAWLSRYNRTIGEMENVLDASLRAQRLEAGFGIRLVSALRGYWYALEPAHGLEWIELALRRPDAPTPLQYARLLTTHSGLLGALGHSASAIAPAERAIAVLEELNEPRALGIAFRDHADALSGAGRTAEAERAYVRASDCFEEVGDAARLASTTVQRATVQYRAGSGDSARELFLKALEVAGAIGESRSESSAYANLAELEFEAGNLDQAVVLVDRAIAIYRAQTSDVGLAITLMNRSAYHLALGRPEAARPDLRESLGIFVRRGRSAWLPIAVQQAATFAAHLGDRRNAARFLGYADSRLRELDVRREPVGERAYRQLVALLRIDERTSPYRRDYDAGAVEEEAAIVAAARAL